MDHLDIECAHPYPAGYEDIFPEFIAYIKKVICRSLPDDFMHCGPEGVSKAIDQLKDNLPIVEFSNPTSVPCTIQLNVITFSKDTHGAGRFLCDLINRWLIPGKQIQIGISHSLIFYFKQAPTKEFFIHILGGYIQDNAELQIVKRQFPKLRSEIQTILRSVVHARKVIASNVIGIEHKRTFIEENLLSLLDRPKKDLDQTMHDLMHQFFIRASSEYNIEKIKENFARLVHKAPHQVDRDIFNEIQHYVLLFRDLFMAARTRHHLYRIISYKYLFRKSIAYAVRENPNRRYMPIKFLPAVLEENQRVLGLIVGYNSLSENEVFEARHILAAVRTYLSDAQIVPNSYIVDNRKDAQVRTCYLEITNKNQIPLTPKELALLRNKLPKELPSRIESISHHLFVHRNEEEVMRNILILSKQLKFVRDIPQVIINFDKQTESTLCFTVILLRLIKPDSIPLRQLLNKDENKFTFFDYDVKIVGNLRKKYPKEANVFEMRVDKHLYLRGDNSIDLYRARQAVMGQLVDLVGEVRDYNGGMISKQTEALEELRSLLKPEAISNDFLLENFFYSTVPTYMQSVIPVDQYRTLFLFLNTIAENPSREQPYQMQYSIKEEFCIIAIGAVDSTFKENIALAIDQLNIRAPEICVTSVRIYDLFCVGYLYRYENKKRAEELISAVKQSLAQWETTLKKSVDLVAR
ncbi:MAG: hypothetical protein H7A40_03170 [Chlamydiales bacterium]|nr:hypothetical protein [Chlamydiales bacterium]